MSQKPDLYFLTTDLVSLPKSCLPRLSHWPPQPIVVCATGGQDDPQAKSPYGPPNPKGCAPPSHTSRNTIWVSRHFNMAT